ncbi:MAG: hypothetical protein A2900_04965 [Candidatus Chisholmbacteria bacterium RIFCSPLOWO2_01_FULL_50_28]|uniref:HAD family hydrolase n=1 Tax=Candidatus Chisholmbacteria bacterium RIFCSPHIGHO2_01_FULL_52_32 TaxID=1797591 RepID=A0A1G1VSP0_9BACT|nr:MAG: hypothetical protein A2786_01775 [Candidatus Chisholmbacteria bacterium RIFCSPHIGHO2_01_FULL_52_32]OGY20399.1 MAG: hypothetical protein A2900_04965 [Candidatus Chisholmbacteria bacterium RIFCSPLOWO2_01_FULL_50_28]
MDEQAAGTLLEQASHTEFSPSWISEIRALGWDLDGTLYRDVPEIRERMEGQVLTTISERLGQDLAWVKKEYRQRLRKIGSNTKVIGSFGLDGPEVVDLSFDQIPFEQLLRPDPKLKRMFASLPNLRHVLITHNRIDQARRKLACLGLPESVFTLVVPVYDWEMSKQDPSLYRKVLELLTIRPHQMLYLGDREAVDILPAREAGLRTGMVWGDSSAADISLPTVYDVGELFQVTSEK